MAVYEVTITIVDEKGRTGRMGFYIPDTATLAQAQAYIDANLQAIEPLHMGAVQNVSLSMPVEYSGLGLRAVPMTGADVEEKMKIAYTYDGRKSFGISIPAFNEAFSTIAVRSNYRVLDFLQDEPNALINLHTDPVAVGHPYGISNRYGDEALTLKSSRQTFFKGKLR